MRRDSRAQIGRAAGSFAPGAHRESGEAGAAEAVLTTDASSSTGRSEHPSREPRTALYFPPSAALHDTGWGHPEHQGRVRAIVSALDAAFPDLAGRVRAAQAPEADWADLARVHSQAHLDRVRKASDEARRAGEQVLCGEETPLSGASWAAIVESSGAAIEAVSRVADGHERNAFVVSRPPGHHASPDRVMGFCPVNHVAVAARSLQETGRAERVLIVDWDVHHGNGTQDVFWEDGTVYYLSIHQAPFYPGTGAATDRGQGGGQGATLNVPVPVGLGREAYVEVFARALDRVEREFDPDVVLVSAGYDALAADPLGGLTLEPEDFTTLTRMVAALATRRCDGRVVACLEGGYHPKRTAEAVLATIRALAEEGAA